MDGWMDVNPEGQSKTKTVTEALRPGELLAGSWQLAKGKRM